MNAPVTSITGTPRNGSGTSGIGGRYRNRMPVVSSSGIVRSQSR
jgi:hypothetical protein